MIDVVNQLLNNPMLISGLGAMWFAQFIKVPIWFIVTGRWSWHLMFDPGGMPSSHAALVCATTLSIGMHEGFNTGVFAISFAISSIVLYDAAGVRRQAGYHAQKINMIFDELLSGHPVTQETLKEVIGHTPRQVIVGAIVGLIVGFLITYYW
jgi:uncharacterized protein